MRTKKIRNDNYFKLSNDILLFSIIITLLDTLSFFSIFYFCDLYFHFFIFLLIFLLFFLLGLVAKEVLKKYTNTVKGNGYRYIVIFMCMNRNSVNIHFYSISILVYYQVLMAMYLFHLFSIVFCFCCSAVPILKITVDQRKIWNHTPLRFYKKKKPKYNISIL